VSDVASDAAQALGTRLGRVGIAPTLAGAVTILLVVWSGDPASLSRIGINADAFTANEWAVLVLVIVLTALVTQPLQLALVRLLEGYAPGPLGAVAGWRRGRHVSRAAGLLKAAGDKSQPEGKRIHAGLRRAAEYPPDAARILPTRLGNALRAFEDTAGEYYGLVTVATWPHLYLVLPESAVGVVEDARNALDSMCRYCITLAVVTPIVAVVLEPQRAVVLLALVPAALAWLSYRAAVSAAIAYGRVVQVMYDLHRFELYTALRLPLPASQDAERAQNARISKWLAQREPGGFEYRTS
jgi:hypothetical protein